MISDVAATGGSSGDEALRIAAQRAQHTGIKNMPEFVECPEMEQFFFGEEGMALHWLSYGTAGWRPDVTPWITDEFWRRFRRDRTTSRSSSA